VSPARSEQGRRVLDEAMRLLDLVQATGPPAGTAQDRDGHLGPDCRICPVCRGIAYLREVDPQAVERLTGALAELAGAVRDLLGAAPAPASPTRTYGGGGGDGDGDAAAGSPGADGAAVLPRVSVQQIDVTD